MFLFPANPILWFDWYISPVMQLVPMAVHGIKGNADIKTALQSCVELASYMLFCGHYNAGCKLLEAVIRVQVKYDISIDEQQKLMLEVLWSARPSLRFVSVPWSPYSKQKITEALVSRRTQACKPTLANYQTPYFGRNGDAEFSVLVNITRAFVNLPVDMQWPHDSARAAFEAMQRLHELLPNQMPITHTWLLEVELALLVEAPKVLDVITRVLKLTWSKDVEWHNSLDRTWMGDCLCFAGFITASSSLPAEMLRLSDNHAEAASEMLVQAIEERIEEGQQLPLQGVNWKDLLERLANAVHARCSSCDPPGNLLHAPATSEEIDQAEGDLGMRLPQDFKDMVAIHNGFDDKAGLLCGGNCGITGLYLQDTEEVEEWLAGPLLNMVEPDDENIPVSPVDGSDGEGSHTESVMIGIMQVNAYEFSSAFIVPHLTWKALGDRSARDGEYRYIHVSTSGDRDRQWPSIRHYIAEQVVEMEVDVAIRQAQTPSPEPGESQDPYSSLQSHYFWRKFKAIILGATRDIRIAEEAVQVCQKALEDHQKRSREGEEIITETPRPLHRDVLPVSATSLGDPRALRQGVDSEKAMRTDRLWLGVQGCCIPYFAEDSRHVEEIVALFRDAWEVYSREKEMAREEEERSGKP